MSGSSTSIFDLLQDEEEQQPTATRRRAGVTGWLRLVLAAAGLAAAVVLGLRMVGVGVSAVAVFAGFLALLLLRRLTRALAPPPPPVQVRLRRPAEGGEEDGSYDWTVRDALGSSVNRWETKLTWSQGEPERFSRAVLPVLAELVDELLRQRHGVTRATDPERARALLGEPLWNFIDTPPKRTPAPRDLAAIVAQLEKL
ncbi:MULTISPECIES: hypothetical protein [unclassified Plantactinospora]|uniref:hypothetical protein n=1 Tax=unclassified Plantactinospora TaxID=2631981 RepID=UPI000D174671|nr:MULTISPECIES: hypothetical protein [unclassified Plantactinospora]AVT31400.1 hypothetical protein C6361_20105 [Plantactinospora sp. BC1]AVT38933.1 hypothetical protein C6W10_23655 [Plantactinospora sp. BB1]